MAAGSRFHVVGGQRVMVTTPYKSKATRTSVMGAGSVRNSPIGGVMMGDEGLRETFQKLDHRPVIWVPAGFGDTHWIVLKMESMIERWFAGKKPIVHVIGEPDPRHNRSGDYIERLPFVDFGGFVPGGAAVILPAFHAQTLAHGHGFDLAVYASRHIEAGLRIEKWMPSLEVNWNYEITETEEDREFGEQFLERHGPFVLVTFFNSGYYQDSIEDMPDERIVGLMHKLAEELHPRKLILTGGWWDRVYHDRLATMGAPQRSRQARLRVRSCLRCCDALMPSSAIKLGTRCSRITSTRRRCSSGRSDGATVRACDALRMGCGRRGRVLNVSV